MKAGEITDCESCPVGKYECISIMRGNTSNMYAMDPPCELWNPDDEIPTDYELPENGLNI